MDSQTILDSRIIGCWIIFFFLNLIENVETNHVIWGIVLNWNA